MFKRIMRALGFVPAALYHELRHEHIVLCISAEELNTQFKAYRCECEEWQRLVMLELDKLTRKPAVRAIERNDNVITFHRKP